MIEAVTSIAPNDLLELIEEVGTDMISVHDAEGTYLYASPSAERLFGWSPAELVGQSAYALFHPEDIARIQRDHAAHGSERDAGFVRYRLRCADGSFRLAETRSRPKLVQGEVRYIVAFTRDVQALYEMEVEATKARAGLTSLGLVAASAAHEIRNPLAYLVTNLEVVRDAIELRSDNESLKAAIADALLGAERVHELSHHLLRLSRPQEDERADEAELRDAVDGAVRMARAHVLRKAGLTVRWETRAERVRGSRWKLSQVVLNLLINAADAMPAGQAAERDVEVRVSDQAGRVLLQVSDDGPGMDEETQLRVFEPLFSTHAQRAGEHAGLGLWICQTLLGSMGLELELESAPGEGTTFTVALEPVERSVAPPAPAPGEREPEPGAGLKVVVVDDDPLVGRALQRSLRERVQVELIADPREALARVDAGQLDCDVLLCDLTMPYVDGRTLLERIRERQPALAERVVLMSGEEPDEALRAFLDERGSRFLGKPFHSSELYAVVQAAAGDAPANGEA